MRGATYGTFWAMGPRYCRLFFTDLTVSIVDEYYSALQVLLYNILSDCAQSLVSAKHLTVFNVANSV